MWVLQWLSQEGSWVCQWGLVLPLGTSRALRGGRVMGTRACGSWSPLPGCCRQGQGWLPAQETQVQLEGVTTTMCTPHPCLW